MTCCGWRNAPGPGCWKPTAEFALPAGDLPRAAELLLRAGAAAVDGLGGKRNRGAGRCWMLLPGMPDPATPADAGVAPVPAAPRPADERLAELAADTSLLDQPGRAAAAARRPGARLRSPTALGASLGDGRRAGDLPGHDGGDHAAGRPAPGARQRGDVPGLGAGVGAAAGDPGPARPAGRPPGPGGRRRPPGGPGRGTSVPALPAPMVWHRPKDRHHHDAVNVAQRSARSGRTAPGDALGSCRSGASGILAPDHTGHDGIRRTRSSTTTPAVRLPTGAACSPTSGWRRARCWSATSCCPPGVRLHAGRR